MPAASEEHHGVGEAREGRRESLARRSWCGGAPWEAEKMNVAMAVDGFPGLCEAR